MSTWQVPDFDRWKRAFDAGMARSERSGLLAYRVCRAFDEADEILLEFEFDTHDHAIAWMAHADEAWLAHAGLDVYPPMFVGEPIEDFRTP
ncbi:MAG: hypothetical protein ABWZ99_00570 [Ilumatobacteraceae bacterium]